MPKSFLTPSCTTVTPSFKWVSGSDPVLWALSLVQTAEFNSNNIMVSSNQKISFLCDEGSLATSQLCPKRCCLESAITYAATEPYILALSVRAVCLVRLPTVFFSSVKGLWEETATLKVSLYRKWIHSCASFISIKLTICSFQVISQVI